MCRDGYENDKRLPPCSETDTCKFTKDGEIFELLPENRFAWSVYLEIREISGYDQNGLPTIGKIDFYVGFFNMGLDHNELEELVEKVIFMNSYMRYLLSATKQGG
ncbi:hypothetical protein LCGC14_1452740 [marine sediment metagenome]|uniref:Uncharacterized protein n=2 Tax=root TaxID=1 RepID=A0A831QMY9_9FLAO|nr:hypothetical protein [Pricia antarctica]